MFATLSKCDSLFYDGQHYDSMYFSFFQFLTFMSFSCKEAATLLLILDLIHVIL